MQAERQHVEHSMSNKGPGQIEVSFEYARHLGPRFIHGAVSLSFDGLRPYGFVSAVQWPDGGNYESAVRKAVEIVLIERQGHLETTLVVLKKISWDEEASCEAGFARAATAAAKAAFEV